MITQSSGVIIRNNRIAIYVTSVTVSQCHSVTYHHHQKQQNNNNLCNKCVTVCHTFLIRNNRSAIYVTSVSQCFTLLRFQIFMCINLSLFQIPLNFQSLVFVFVVCFLLFLVVGNALLFQWIISSAGEGNTMQAGHWLHCWPPTVCQTFCCRITCPPLLPFAKFMNGEKKKKRI